MEAFAKNQEQMRTYMRESFGGIFPFDRFQEMSKQNIAFFEQAMRMWSPFRGNQQGGEPAMPPRPAPSRRPSPPTWTTSRPRCRRCRSSSRPWRNPTAPRTNRRPGPPAMIDLKGKTVLVTGGSRGIGEAIVRAVAAAGGDVLLHYSQEPRGGRGDPGRHPARDLPPAAGRPWRGGRTGRAVARGDGGGAPDRRRRQQCRDLRAGLRRGHQRSLVIGLGARPAGEPPCAGRTVQAGDPAFPRPWRRQDHQHRQPRRASRRRPGPMALCGLERRAGRADQDHRARLRQGQRAGVRDRTRLHRYGHGLHRPRRRGHQAHHRRHPARQHGEPGGMRRARRLPVLGPGPAPDRRHLRHQRRQLRPASGTRHASHPSGVQAAFSRDGLEWSAAPGSAA